MKISRGHRSSGLVQGKSGASAQAARKASTSRSDRVELSGSSEEIGGLTAMMSQIPDYSIEKIPQISQQLDAGIYHVEASDVAEKILDRWKDFSVQHAG